MELEESNVKRKIAAGGTTTLLARVCLTRLFHDAC